MTAVCSTACDANCKVCNSGGEGKCDVSQCDARYAYNSETKTCLGGYCSAGHTSITGLRQGAPRQGLN